MVISQVHINIWLLLTSFLFLSVYGQTSGPYFMVTFPAVIGAGSDAKFCVSLLKPNETLQMKIYLVHNNQSRTLLQKTVEKDLHQCFYFETPQVEGTSVQEMRVEVKGETFKITEERKVMFKCYDTSTFIQTDKPIYNPGQTVNFRIVSMDYKLIPFKQTYSTVSLQDNHGNRIGQWTNVSSTGLILQLSHELNAEAPRGHYKLIADTGKRLIEHSFLVNKYVLPKFEVTLKAPEEHSIGDEVLKLEVCGKYIYGQSVPGQVVAKVCRKVWQSLQEAPCLSETVNMSQNGCAFLIFNVSNLMNTEFEENFENHLVATAILTEEGTDFFVVESNKIRLSFQIGNVEILDSHTTFEWGKFIGGKIKVTTFSGTPIPNKKVYLSECEQGSQTLLLNLTTDSNGLANFSVPSPEYPKTEITLMASVHPKKISHAYKTPFFSNAAVHIQLFQPATPYSPVFSELSIESSEEPFKCGAEIPITINYYIVGETTESYSIDLIYMVLSKGAIVHHGHKTVEVEESTDLKKGNISVKISVDAELSSLMQFVVYSVLPSENIIADGREFLVEKCFINKVSLQFSPSKAIPGEKNTLELSAFPGSLCGLSAVDHSVYIESNKQLNTDKIFNLLHVKSESDYPYTVEDELKCLHVRPQRDVWNDHVYNLLKRVGLKMATNLAVRQPRCLVYKGMRYHSYHSYDLNTQSYLNNLISSDYEGLLPELQIRKLFPETWIWQLVEVGDSGLVQLHVTVPDTITTWDTDAFCVSSRGLGLAPTVQLTVFKPFFLELSLPYSIIWGEDFELNAIIYNYLLKCIMIKVTPAPSSDYILKPSSDAEYSSCLCAYERKTFKWTLIPSVLGVLNVTVNAEAEQSQTVCDNEIVSVPERGHIDTVTRSLIVQAEGTKKSKSQSWLLCPQGNSVSEELELTPPEDVIEGSARASVSVLGDIIGHALKNLDGLLMMPHSCGEQNIAILASNIYILQYLENTQQLTTDIHDKATGFLKSGYQRQLNYKHFNGAYSTFGWGEENTWLTAFVLKTFGKAQRYIFIDPESINRTNEWLIGMQRSNGCFKQQGLLFDNRIKCGVNDDVTITAYITAAFLELGITVQDPVVNKGLFCLKSSTGNLTNTYTTALLAYTFSLAGEKEIRGQLLKALDDVAVSGDGQLYWSQSASDDSCDLSVEISSYVLLGVLTSGQLTAANLGYANRIVSWLVKQQNPNRGFSSTQDTIVALQALALYSTKVFSSEGSSTVTVKSADGHSHKFDVHQNNKLLYQERPLQDVPGKYRIDVKGSTCVSVQAALFYNVPTRTETSTLSITATTEANCKKSFGEIVYLHFTITYNPKLHTSTMVVVDIKLLSGFIADPFKLSFLEYSSLVKRVDSKADHIIIYTKELQRNTPIGYQIHLNQVYPVKNLKPALIKVYDYYQTNNDSETEYTSPCV